MRSLACERWIWNLSVCRLQTNRSFFSLLLTQYFLFSQLRKKNISAEKIFRIKKRSKFLEIFVLLLWMEITHFKCHSCHIVYIPYVSSLFVAYQLFTRIPIHMLISRKREGKTQMIKCMQKYFLFFFLLLSFHLYAIGSDDFYIRLWNSSITMRIIRGIIKQPTKEFHYDVMTHTQVFIKNKETWKVK